MGVENLDEDNCPFLVFRKLVKQLQVKFLKMNKIMR